MAIVRLSGNRALPIFSTISRQGDKPLSPRVASLRKLIDPDDGNELDTVLVLYFPAPSSYTGEDVVEISAHGNPHVVSRICECAVIAGARYAEPGEFTRRAFLNGKMDLSQAEAVQELISARTLLAAKAAEKRQSGALGRRIDALRETLMKVLTNLEVSIDFPEEDEPFASEEELILELQEGCATIDELLLSFRLGRALDQGLRIAITGKPNVGKSSLLNCFLQEERAIVSPVPGTTRDFISEPLSMGGIPLRMIDTAGLRVSPVDSLEREGLERSKRIIEEADIILFVIDGSEPITDDDRSAMKAVAGKVSVLVVNKIDLGTVVPFRQLCNEGEFAAHALVSAREGSGLSSLEEIIYCSISEGLESNNQDVLIGSLRQKYALERGKGQIKIAMAGLREKRPPEIVSIDLNEAIGSLTEIVGEITTEEVLNRIFSEFCIGK